MIFLGSWFRVAAPAWSFVAVSHGLGPSGSAVPVVVVPAAAAAAAAAVSSWSRLGSFPLGIRNEKYVGSKKKNVAAQFLSLSKTNVAHDGLSTIAGLLWI